MANLVSDARYNATHHRFAVITAAAAFFLLIAGALVTSNDAGLSVPDWPTSFGSMWRLPNMVGGVRFEHSHRMIAEFVGLLTVLLAVITWRADRRSWHPGRSYRRSPSAQHRCSPDAL